MKRLLEIFRNTDLRDDLGAGPGIFKSIMMFEGEPEMTGHNIQLMAVQVRQGRIGRFAYPGPTWTLLAVPVNPQGATVCQIYF